MKRMDRYREESDNTRMSRSDNNKELYETIGSNTRYTSFTDVANANAIDLSSKKNSNRREGYHQMKEYQDIIPTTRTKKDLDEFKSIYHSHENKVYDINNVLEEARKNRQEKDLLDEKRKLKNTSYNILASLNPEELEKYREEKLERPIRATDDFEDDLEDDSKTLVEKDSNVELKTLVDENNQDSGLFDDLMATNVMDKIGTPEEIEETNKVEVEEESSDSEEKTKKDSVEEEKEEKPKEKLSYLEAMEKEKLDLQEFKKMTEKIEQAPVEESKPEIMENADNDFYTRSMDLSACDFEEEIKEKKLPLGIKILIFLVIIVILGAVFYFLWRNI